MGGFEKKGPKLPQDPRTMPRSADKWGLRLKGGEFISRRSPELLRPGSLGNYVVSNLSLAKGGSILQPGQLNRG